MADANQNSNNNRNITCECETSKQQPIDFLGDSICKVSVSSVREIVKKYEPDKEIGNLNFHPIPHYNNRGGHTVAPAITITTHQTPTDSSAFNNNPKIGLIMNTSNSNNSNTTSGIDVASSSGGGGGGGGGVGSVSFSSTNDSSGTALSYGSVKSNSSSGKKFNLINHVLHEEQTANPAYGPIQQQSSSVSQHSKESYDLRNRNKGNSTQYDFEKEIADASYKSRTSITKTSQGIRITTDIFFDSSSKIPENWIVKRVETDIPPSKIISEFQKNNGA